MVSLHRGHRLIRLDAYARESALRSPDPDARLVDPGFPREPCMIGAANRATSTREKHRAAPEALAISLDAGGDRVSGLRTLDHDHTHVALLGNCFLLSLAEKHRPVGVRLLSVRATWGASRTLSDRASGSGAHARHWAYSYRPDPSSTEPLTLSATCSAGSMKTLGEVFPGRLPVSVAFGVTFTSLSLTAQLSFPGESIPRDARRRHESARAPCSIQILGEP